MHTIRSLLSKFTALKLLATKVWLILRTLDHPEMSLFDHVDTNTQTKPFETPTSKILLSSKVVCYWLPPEAVARKRPFRFFR